MMSIALSLMLPADAWGQGARKPDEIAAFAQVAPVPHGEIRVLWYGSKAFGTQRRMHVYTPPGYEAGTVRYPVVYLLHGGASDDASWMNDGHAEFILDTLIAQGTVKPMILVMPASGPVDPRSDTFAGNNTLEGLAGRKQFADGIRGTFLRDLTGSIVPFVDRTFRTLRDRRERAVAGYSFGGAETLWAATRDLDTFASFGVFSMGIQVGSTGPANAIAGSGVAVSPVDFVAANAPFFQNPAATNASLRYLAVMAGKDDRIVGNGPAQLDGVLARHGIRHDYILSDGGHDFRNWQVYLRDFLVKVFRMPHS